MNICNMCGRRGGCGCLWESPALCKKCGADSRGEVLSRDIEMEIEASNTIEMHVGQKGLGDSICALYAAAGLARTGRTVVLATKHGEWFDKVKIDGVRLVEDRETKVNVCGDYNAHLRQSNDRKQWYCDAIARQVGIEKFCPDTSFKIVPPANQRIEGKYVLLAPFAAWDSRSWPVTHWRRLCELLSSAGLQPVVIDSPGDGKRVRDGFAGVPCKFYWGMESRWVTDVVQHSKCVIGNDSGIPHLAALLGKRTVAVHAHLSPEHVFSYTNVVSVTPDDSCKFCAWQRSRSYGAACDGGCSALMGISANRVFEAVMKTIGGEK